MYFLRTFLAVFAITASMAASSQPALDPGFSELERQYSAAYAAADYAAAQGVLRTMTTLPDAARDPQLRGKLLFRIACLDALQGNRGRAIQGLYAAVGFGFGSAEVFAAEKDLQSLREDPEFKVLLTELDMRAAVRAKASAVAAGLKRQALGWDPSEPSVPFQMRFDDPGRKELAELRSLFNVEDALQGTTGDYDTLIRLSTWTSVQWEHDGAKTASRRDPLTILREARSGGKFLCHDYAVVLAGMARAHGLTARHVMVLPRDVEQRAELHSVVEVWLPEFSKWVVADAQFGIVPEVHSLPVSAVELQKAIAQGAPITCRGAEEKCAEWQAFIFPNLFYFKVSQDQRRFGGDPKARQLVLVPLGAPHPRMFAGGDTSVFANAIYTSNPDSLYVTLRREPVEDAKASK